MGCGCLTGCWFCGVKFGWGWLRVAKFCGIKFGFLVRVRTGDVEKCDIMLIC